LINDEEVQRVDERAGGFHRAGLGEYGPRLQHEYKRFVPKYPLSGALVTMTGALGHLVDAPSSEVEQGDTPGNTPWGVSSWSPMPPIAESQAPGTDEPVAMARHIKEAAYFLRADLVGICKLQPYAVFSNNKFDGKPVELDHKYAIAILIDQDWRTSAAFSGYDWISNSMSFLSYSNSGFIACILADYIRRLGYPARAHHAMNYQVAVPPILLWAGLGEMCRIGDVVLNPFLGPRFKAAIVTTDLPMDVDRPIDFGLQDFCTKCGKCAEACPSQSISYGDKILFNGYEKWDNNVAKCTAMRVGNQLGSGCGSCVKVCPWNKPYTPFHRTVNWSMRKFPSLRKLGIWADDVLGYGKPDYSQKWWLDLERVNGETQTPRKRSKKALYFEPEEPSEK
jgi:reductive dehalogenase